MVDIGKDNFTDLHHTSKYIYMAHHRPLLDDVSILSGDPEPDSNPSTHHSTCRARSESIKMVPKAMKRENIKGTQTTPLGTMASEISQISCNLILC
jgi:hypothetical protein